MPVTVLQIIDALNVGGRQGPQDVASRECLDWVRKQVSVTRDEYLRLVEEHTIPDSRRTVCRDALFTRSSSGRVVLFKSNADELRPYVCLAVRRLTPPVTSDRVLAEVKRIFPLTTPVDLMNQNNLASRQDRIDQMIRNILVSNYHNVKNCAVLERSASTPYLFALKPEGEVLAEKAAADLDRARTEEERAEGESGEATPDPSLGIYTEEEMQARSAADYTYTPPAAAAGGSRRQTDKKLLNTVLARAGYRCAVDAQHRTFEGAGGLPNFLEGHHLIPLSFQRYFEHVDLDCPENLVPLCPNCHRALHCGTAAVRQAVLRSLMTAYCPQLNRIGISEEQIVSVFEKAYLCRNPE